MAGLKTFPLGGLHPRSIGLNTMDKPIRNAHLPHFVRIPLSQHIGTPARPVVAVGDRVEAGDVIGKASGFVSVNIHTSLPGKVVEIVNQASPLAAKVPTIVIEFEGYFNVKQRNADHNSWRNLSNQEIISKMQDKGLVGLGGATFPTHVKYSVPKDKNIDALIINGVECEPYLSADYRVMLERSQDLLTGIEIARTVLGVENVYIGIESDKPEAIAKLADAAAAIDHLSVVPLQLKYPQGAEKQLIKAILQREVPSGGLPMDVGTVVSNVGTILALKEAVVDDVPLTERVVTVTGSIVENPGNYKIKIGTPLKDVLEEFGLREEPGKIVFGGPMMGLAQYDEHVPITKGTSGVLVLSRREAKYFRHAPCVRCGRCLTVCPMGLDPTRLVTLIELGKDDQALQEGTLDCIECGCCSYICPSQRHLGQSIKLGKLRNIMRKKEAAGD